MPYICIRLVTEDTEAITSYDLPATNRYVKVFQAGIDSAEDAWYAIYTYRGNIGTWVADCASLTIARTCAKALGDKYGMLVKEDFSDGYQIKDIERPLV